ncbi:MAG TPA: hypothetical protein VIV11_29110 [Kofleriaceae bacterium]
MRAFAAAAAAIVVAACSGTEPAPIPKGFVPLLQGDWSLPPGEEGYFCVRATPAEDMYIRSYRPIAPIGTHHTALAFDLMGGADGSFPCEARDAGFRFLFGSGLGTETYTLPDGVAMKLPAGEQIMLNLHLYNTSDAVLTGTSGVEIERVAPEDVVHEAEVIYALNFDLNAPPGVSKTVGECTVDGNSTIFGTFPHMHRLGTHLKGAVMRGDSPILFHDEPYNFETQLNYRVGPIDVMRGEKVQYECTFDNPTGQTVSFGDSTDSEMCVLGMYRYPARGSVSLCIN